MTAAATLAGLGRRFSGSAWLVIGGLAGLGVGGLAQGAVGALNVNGGQGGWPVLLLGAAAVGGAAAAAEGRAGLAAATMARWRDLPVGLAVGLLTVGLLDLAELIRGIDESMAGGLVGMLGRMVVAGSAVALVLGLLARRRGDASWLAGVRATPRYNLARLGGIAVVLGWAVLVSQGQGFAVRAIDALGLVVAAVIVAGLGSTRIAEPADRPGRATAAILAITTVLIGLDTLLIVVGHLGTLGIGGPATAAGYVIYLVGVVIVGLGGVQATIGLRRPRPASG